MQPFSRETITDRRQPSVRWTAVIAGALVALGTWMLLQLLFTGGTLSAIDPDDLDNARGYGIGTGIGSVLAPLIAMFLGGLVAGRLAAYYDRAVSAFHGVLTWAIASVLGLALLGTIVGSLASKHALAAHDDMGAPPAGANEFVDSTLDNVNAQQEQQNAPKIEKADLLDAARYSLQGRDHFDRNAFIARLDDKTSLSRPEAEAVLANLGDRASDVMVAANQVAYHRQRAAQAADTAGNAMLATGVGLLLCLITAAAGSILGANLLKNRRNTVGPAGGEPYPQPRDARITDRGSPGFTTAEYPPVTPNR